MIDGDLLDLIRRAIVALERIAASYPAPEERPRQPAILSTATYTREERDRKEFEALEAQKPPRRVAAPLRSQQ